jgi:hypothetical protein
MTEAIVEYLKVCILIFKIECVLRIIYIFIVFIVLYVSHYSTGRINTAYFSRNFATRINTNT